MTRKQIFKRIITVFMILLVISICFVIFFRKSLIKNIITKKALAFGFIQPDCTVKNISLSSLNIKDLKVGKLKPPDWSISSISIDFSPFSILKGNIKKIMLSGIQINLDIIEKKLKVRGFPTQLMKKSPGTKIEPLQVKELTFESSSIMINLPDNQLKVPVEGTIKLGENPSLYKFDITINPLGDKIQAIVDLDINKGKGTFVISSPSIRMENIPEFLNIQTDFLFKGKITVIADGKIDNWSVTHLDVNISNNNFKTANPYLYSSGGFILDVKFSGNFEPVFYILEARLSNLNFQDYSINEPFILNIEGTTLDDLDFSLTSLKISRPYELNLFNVKGKMSWLHPDINIKGNYHAIIPQKALSSLIKNLKITTPVDLNGKFAVSVPFSLDKTSWEFSGTLKQPFSLTYNSGSITSFFKELKANISLAGDGNKITAQIDMDSRDTKYSTEDFNFYSNRLLSKTIISYQYPGKFLAGGSFKIFSSRLNAGTEATAQGIDADFSWQWPMLPEKGRSKTESGTFKIESLNISGTTINKISGNIQQHKKGATFSSCLTFPIPKVMMDITSDILFTDTGIDVLSNFEIPLTTIPSNTSLEPLHPYLKDIKASGDLILKGRFLYQNNVEKTDIKIILKNGSFTIKPVNIFMDGIDVELNLNGLLQLTSLPSQQFKFQKMNWGNIVISNGMISFELEGPNNLFIEKSEFQWCNGKILSHAFRYHPNINSLPVTIFCDRVDFNDMLNIIMGDNIATGDGKLNGIIPLVFNEGNVSIDDGYLYSRPGAKGNIKIKQSQQISGGVVIVEEAMKDFLYDSIKVNLNTTGNNLNIFVYINGTPKQKLPLLYNSKTKSFVRHSGGKGRINLKGLLLELRFLDIDVKSLLKSGALLKYISNRK